MSFNIVRSVRVNKKGAALSVQKMSFCFYIYWRLQHCEERVDDPVWKQSQEDINDIWRFHDGSRMPVFLQPYIDESNHLNEDRFWYRIPDDKFADRNPIFLHIYMVERRLF